MLTSKGNEILSNMIKEYGVKRGNGAFYASINSGKITGAEVKKKKRSILSKMLGMKSMANRH